VKQPGKLSAFIFFLVFGAISLFARDIEITVLDYDLSLPLEGAIVRNWDGKEQICNNDGKVIISIPDNRQFVIHAMYPGYETGRLIINLTNSSYTIRLRLSGVLENRELVIEAERPGTNETQTGRSIAVSGRDINQTAEIGIIEDVMSSIKLLPGVGYAGFFNAMPSIRGGDPSDIRASLDGFYIFHPYHWGGGFSIFSPRMVESAQLSHGVFSSRYGNTISGLLEITSKKPSPTETEFEIGASTSAASFSLSLPLFGKGGVLFMGNVTYYDPVIALAKQVVNSSENEDMEALNAIRTAPYIRSATVTGNYRFTSNLELTGTGFFGMDGVGVLYEDSLRTDDLNSDSDMKFNWVNYQFFLTGALGWNPRNDTLVKFTGGVGYHNAIMDAYFNDHIHEKTFSVSSWYYNLLKDNSPVFSDTYSIDTHFSGYETNKLLNLQARVDVDFDFNNGFLIAAGIQEYYMNISNSMEQKASSMDLLLNDDNFSAAEQLLIFESMGIINPIHQAMLKNNMLVIVPATFDTNVNNHLFTTSAYGLVEYASPNNRFNAEFGLRIDHFYLTGRDNLSLQSTPTLNPRLNIDYNLFNNFGVIRSFNMSAGSGLFSSINDMLLLAESKYGVSEIKPNRSWTSILGAKFEFTNNMTFNIEGYYKYIFDRAYIPINFGIDGMDVDIFFNGEGMVWGIDVMLQKKQSRFWDGWLSYSWNWTKYRDPNASMEDLGYSGGNTGGNWYYPTFHRFHNLNLVFNFKPRTNINIYTRFGIASGVQLSRLIGDSPISLPVYVYDKENPENSKFIEKYFWDSERDENNRSTPSFPMDVKLSIFGSNKTGKTRYEVYVAVENVLALLYTAQGNANYNQYTGEIITGSESYDIPIPIPSFGVKFSY